MISATWLDPWSRDEMIEVVALLSDFWREVIPDEPDQSVDEIEAANTYMPEHRRSYLAVATDGGDIVGTARLVLDDAIGREDTGEADFLVVGPDYRRRRVGTDLLGLLVERARSQGRTRLRGFLPTAHSAAMGFASECGATPGLRDHHNRVLTKDLDRALLEGWVTRARERADGYSLVSFDGICPDRWLESFAELTGVMNTAPRSEGEQDSLITPEQLRGRQESVLRRGQWSWTVCARHDATDRLVGYTELFGSKYRPWLGEQGDTGVEPAHRDRGLGRWVKAVNALRLLDERPDVTVIDTWNAGVNAPMLAINETMGFRCVAEWQEWILSL